MDGRDVERSRADLRRYVLEALRLEPQGEVLLRVCAKQGATIADSRPLRAGTLVFTAHGSAMQDIEQADTFVLGRDARHYLQYGAGRHKCLGQYVSPVLMLESLVALLALENLHRPQAGENETAFPRETRFGHFQLDVDNLYANTFTLAFDDQGTTRQYYRWERP
jgi:cytochrome P450